MNSPPWVYVVENGHPSVGFHVKANRFAIALLPGKHRNPYPFFRQTGLLALGFQVDGNERRNGDVFQVVCGFQPI